MKEQPMKEQLEKCPYAKKCGSCGYQGVTYAQQLKRKEAWVKQLTGKYGKVAPIVGMEDPYYYRNKVHRVMDRDRRGNPVAGTYRENTHQVVPIDHCQIEDEQSQKIIETIRGMLKSFKIRTYDEDTGYGLLRHILVRKGFQSGEIMVVLVLSSPILPSKNNFVKALRKVHPKIDTIVINVNDQKTSMVLGPRNIVLYGKGFIRDRLCDCSFRISPDSFYQVNPVQTEKLYRAAIRAAGLTGKERVLDAYCGIGTIGLIASEKAKEVVAVELNKNAVRDAIANAKENQIRNVRFVAGDAGEFMEEMAAQGEAPDVVFMDPPRAGSDKKFLESLVRTSPSRVVYISCNPETLARDLGYLTAHRYRVQRIEPYDMFPFTKGVEACCLLARTGK